MPIAMGDEPSPKQASCALKVSTFKLARAAQDQRAKILGEIEGAWITKHCSEIKERSILEDLPNGVLECQVLRGDSLSVDSLVSYFITFTRLKKDNKERFIDIQQALNKIHERKPMAAGEASCPSKSHYPSHLTPTSQDFRIFKYRNPRTMRANILFKCDIGKCQLTFIKLHCFLDHQRTHTGHRPFSCPFSKSTGCNSSFAQKSNLNKHLVSCHN